MDYSGRNKGIAKASFELIHQATSAMEAVNGKFVHDRPIRITFSRVNPTRPVGKTSNMLFIGGLPHDVTESEVRHGVAGFDGLQQIQISKHLSYLTTFYHHREIQACGLNFFALNRFRL